MYTYIYLGAALAAVGATDELDVSAAVLVATSISALESLQRKNTKIKQKETEDGEMDQTRRLGRSSDHGVPRGGDLRVLGPFRVFLAAAEARK